MTVLIFDGDFVSVLNHFMITHFIQSIVSSPFRDGSKALFITCFLSFDKASISEYGQLQQVSLCRALRSTVHRLTMWKT